MENRKVLFVDDDEKILKAVRRQMRSEPYECYFAIGGKAALDLMEKETIHVIVTDLGMPEMDGLTLLKHVQQKHPDIVRLILSAYADTNSILKAINRGNVYRYIVKPWNDMDLEITIRQAIDLFNLQQEKRDLHKKLEDHNRLLEKRVKERTRRLLAIKSKAEIGKYSSEIVHNLNSPIQAIQEGLDLARFVLSDENPALKKLDEYLHNIQSGISDLEKIITGILVHVKDENLLSTEKVDINEIVKRELEFYELNRTFRNLIEKNIDLSQNLPYFQGNEVHIKQIVDNLVKNAIDAMERSRDKVLTVETYLKGRKVCILISDTGEGIYKENLAKIFSPDFTTKPISKGTGLGLASVKTMVNAYSGDIRVKSERGKGTTVVVAIPLEKKGD